MMSVLRWFVPGLRTAAAAVCILGVAACASGAPPTNRRAQSIVVDGLDIGMMAYVVKQGFTDVRDRAYEEPSVDTLFMHALRGLTVIDADVGVTDRGGQLLLTYAGAPLPPTAIPAHGNIDAWTKATLSTVLTFRHLSVPMKAATSEDIYKAIFPPALKVLDPYSRYASPDEAIRSRLVRDGIIGLGIRVVPAKSGVSIQSIVRNGPGEQAGLKLEDVISFADGKPLTGRTSEEARQMLEGKSGTDVQLTVLRTSTPAPLSITVRRDLVIAESVTSEIVDGVVEIRIRSFNQRTAQNVEKAVLSARASGDVQGIVLDLRSDPGGLLDQAVDLADLFLDTGTIITLRGRHPGAQQFYAAHAGDIADGLPVAVVIDGRAASASEIVAVALQDHARAAVVGTVSLGKGSVQTVIRLPNQGEIILTWSRAFTPRGALLHGLGVLPDVCLSGEAATLGDTVGRIFSKRSLSDELTKGWRVPPAQAESLEALRAACPPEAHPDRAIDLEVARRLVKDPVLFAQALQGSARQLAEKP